MDYTYNQVTQQAAAWLAVCEVLNQVAPGWTGKSDTGLVSAVTAIRELAARKAPAKPERRPFDLEAAKRGEALVTRYGKAARFVAHVPDAKNKGARVIAMIEGDDAPQFYDEDGWWTPSGPPSNNDLFMATQPGQIPLDAAVEFHPNGLRTYVTFEINGQQIKKVFERCALSEEWEEVLCG